MARLFAAAFLFAAYAAEPNPPVWPSSVSVFGPDSTDIEDKVNAAYANNGGHDPKNHGQFSSDRYAFLFKPGTYEVDVPVGYYTQVMGLGTSPSDVVFTSPKGVYSQEQDFSIGGALSTFWRAAENFKTEANNKWYVGTGMMWAVSQAAPVRRVEVTNDLCLFEYEPPIPGAGESSGGYFSGITVGGKVTLGSQQQWFARDSTVADWEGGVWNVVVTGVEGAPPSHCGNANGAIPMTNLPTTPLIADKPFISIDAKGKYSLQVPKLQKATKGASYDLSLLTAVSFESVYVTRPADTADAINAKLAAGLHVVITPGIYKLDKPLVINKEGQVVLGIGFPTLIPTKQNLAISVGDVDDVRIAGLLLQAGAPASDGSSSPALLQFGSGAYQGNPSKPGIISDVFSRVGGPDGTASDPVSVDTQFHLRSGNTIIDNTWLWRADHAVGGTVEYSTNRNKHCLVVDGDDVITYGLASEHAEQDLVQWNGNGGKVHFFQSELPYIVNQAQFGDPGYAGYRVSPNVTTHEAYGVGVYSFFSTYNVTVKSAIVCPPALEKNFVNPLTVFLNGYGEIQHIINDKGDPAVPGTNVHYYCPSAAHDQADADGLSVVDLPRRSLSTV